MLGTRWNKIKSEWMGNRSATGIYIHVVTALQLSPIIGQVVVMGLSFMGIINHLQLWLRGCLISSADINYVVG